MIRRVGAIFFVMLFVLGTATTIFLFQPSVTANTSTASTGSSVPASTVPPAGVIELTPGSAAQPTSGPQMGDLVKKAEDAGNAGNWNDAISYYKAALGLTNGNASIEYALGKAYIQTKQYDLAVSHLQTAVNLNPDATFAGDAKSLIDSYKGQVTPGASTGDAGTVAPAATTATTPTK